MKRIFLYLYPIEEYTSMFLLSDDSLYDELNIKRPMPILNECIQKRYRDNDYQVVFVLYPDKNIFGINLKPEDKIIFTDVLFSEISKIDENIKKDYTLKYPNEQFLLKQLGNIDELVVGGYHAQDCVKKVAHAAIDIGINTIIDLDMTDFFFSLYRQDEYFDIEKYNFQKFVDYQMQTYGEDFNKIYSLDEFSSNNQKLK